MPDYDRYVSCTLGALLLDGIIPADLKVIESTIASLRRAAAHANRTAQDRPRRAAEDGLNALNRPVSPIATTPAIRPETRPISQSSKKHDGKRPETPQDIDNDPNPAG